MLVSRRKLGTVLGLFSALFCLTVVHRLSRLVMVVGYTVETDYQTQHVSHVHIRTVHGNGSSQTVDPLQDQLLLDTLNLPQNDIIGLTSRLRDCSAATREAQKHPLLARLGNGHEELAFIVELVNNCTRRLLKQRRSSSKLCPCLSPDLGIFLSNQFSMILSEL